MEVQAHTTSDTRKQLRDYLRDRRLTGSTHHRIAAQTLNDLEAALRLLADGIDPNSGWSDQAREFLGRLSG